jgi:hypothetical protein
VRAKKGSSYVFTERGPEAEQSLNLHDVPEKPVGGQRCPHDGLMLFGIPVCGFCGDPRQQMGHAIMFLARRVSRQIRGCTFTPDDVIGTVALALVINTKQILKAANPTGLATTIAMAAARKLYRHLGGIKSTPVGKMDLGSDEGEPIETTTQKLDYLDGLLRTEEMNEKWRRQCYEGVRTFPGIDVVWNEENFQLLKDAIEEAKLALPTYPINVWTVIDMRLGLSGPDFFWTDIAKMFSKLEPISPKQVSRTYDAGLGVIREHLLRMLVPPMTKAPDVPQAKIGDLSPGAKNILKPTEPATSEGNAEENTEVRVRN